MTPGHSSILQEMEARPEQVQLAEEPGQFWRARRDSNLSRLAGVSEAGARRRNPERKRRITASISGAPGEIRTPDLMLRRHSLYPAELRARC